MNRRYKNSPIAKSICEFQFEDQSEWDLTVPGLVYDRVHNEFPTRRHAASSTLGIQGDRGNIPPQFGSAPLLQFVRPDEKALLQIGPHLLSVHLLNPYSSWSEFLPLIQTGFHEYCDVARPKAIQRLGLRYINRIEIQTKMLD